MNLSVETQLEVLFFCVRFFYCLLLLQLASKCVRMHLRHHKISMFSGGACPWTPLATPVAMLPAGVPMAAKLATPNQKTCLWPCHIMHTINSVAKYQHFCFFFALISVRVLIIMGYHTTSLNTLQCICSRKMPRNLE